MTACVLRRIYAKVSPDPVTGCWAFTGGTNGQGYGRIQIGDALAYPHRVMYEAHVGPIPDDHEIDHLCRNRACCNPAHLEAVTRRENLLRGDTLTRAHHLGLDCGFDGCKNCSGLRARELHPAVAR